MLYNVIRAVPPERRPVLEEQLRLLDTGILRSFSDEEDRMRAAIADLQGVGGAAQDGNGRADTSSSLSRYSGRGPG